MVASQFNRQISFISEAPSNLLLILPFKVTVFRTQELEEYGKVMQPSSEHKPDPSVCTKVSILINKVLPNFHFAEGYTVVGHFEKMSISEMKHTIMRNNVKYLPEKKKSSKVSLVLRPLNHFVKK